MEAMMGNLNHMAFCLEANMNRLREVRVVKRMTQFQLRLITGVHQSKISFIENGLVEAREDEKKRLARALGVRIQDIWKTSDSEKRNEVQAAQANQI
jgi:DNA-binding XRE family transcriptional regulator